MSSKKCTNHLSVALSVTLSVALTSCATIGEQTRAVLHSPPNVPAESQIDNVPFIAQAANQCGPSTLAMMLSWAGQKSSAEELTPEVFTATRKGSLQLDLISAARRRGLNAMPIQGLHNLLREVAEGHPVIVLENLAFSWWPKWHYAIVFGYDLKAQTLILHSGRSAFKREPMNYFERNWQLADYWGLVVLPAGRLSASASELVHLQAAVGLEQANWPVSAENTYHRILERWPTSLAALIGLGNLAYNRKDFGAAVVFLRKATHHHPDSMAAFHNLKVAEKAKILSSIP